MFGVEVLAPDCYCLLIALHIRVNTVRLLYPVPAAHPGV